MQEILPLKELRQHVNKYATRVKKGDSFVVMRRSQPLFRICPIEEDLWETVIDFTLIRKGGIAIEELLARL